MKPPQVTQPKSSGRSLQIPLLLFILVSALFARSYLPGYILFTNDDPLGTLVSESHRLPQEFTGGWQDLNSIGYREGGACPTITHVLAMVLGPVIFSKSYAPIAVFLLGLGAWFFFRKLGL